MGNAQFQGDFFIKVAKNWGNLLENFQFYLAFIFDRVFFSKRFFLFKDFEKLLHGPAKTNAILEEFFCLFINV